MTAARKLSLPTAPSPLGLKIEAILRDAEGPLTVVDIQRRLRQTGQPVPPALIERVLQNDSVFDLISDGRWWLRSRLHELRANEPDEGPSLRREAASPDELPLLRNLPQARHDYVVLDLETTGTDATTDQIVQVVAIRYAGGRPMARFSRRCHPGRDHLSTRLMRKLGFLERPATWEATLAAPPFAAQTDELRAFIKDLPIVAHNARFDAGFLRHALGSLDNPIVDTQELAYLLLPELDGHTLAEVADALGVKFSDAASLWSRLRRTDPGARNEPDIEIDSGSLHDATTDTSLLALTYRALLERLDELPPSSATLALLPELKGERWTGCQLDVRALLQAEAPSLPADLPKAPPVVIDRADEAAVVEALGRFCAHRGYAERRGQTEMTLAVHRAFAEGRFSLIEAPTGTGKSIAYLIPAMLHAAARGERVLISTAYRPLQDQLLKDVGQLEEATGIPVRFQVMKGLGNEFCRDRLVHAIAALDVEAALDERFSLAFMCAWLVAKPDADRDEFPYWMRRTFPVVDHVLDELSAAGSGCGTAACRALGCAAWRRAELAKGAHLLLVNHALWLADPERLPAATRLVVDEAHLLEEAATSALTEEASLVTLLRILRRLLDRRTGRGVLPRILAQRPPAAVAASARRAIDAVGVVEDLGRSYGDVVQTFVRRASGKGVDRHYGAVYRLEAPAARIAPTLWPPLERASRQLYDSAIGDLLAALDELRDRLAKSSGAMPEPDMFDADLRDITEDLVEQQTIHRAVVGARRRADVHWIALEPAERTEDAEPPEPGEAPPESSQAIELRNWAFRRAPIRVESSLQQRYAEVGGAVFTSATLALASGDFRFFRERLGLDGLIDRSDELVVPAELDYAANAFLALVNFLDASPSNRTMTSFQDELAKELAQFLPFTGGRALGLFTSRARLEEVTRRLRPELDRFDLPLLSQTDGESRRALLDEFRTIEESTLLGLRSYWEGVDVPGPSLSFVLMEKLPFPSLNDPITSARREDVAARGGNDFMDYLFPLMAFQFKQGFGRLLRSKKDRGAVLLYDKRVHRKGYLPDLLAALPGFVPRDRHAERDRRRLYEALGRHLPDIIDLEKHRDFLNELPERLLTDLETKLAQWQLPAIIADAEYDAVRPTLLEALANVFRFSGFRSQAQEDVVRHMLTGRDVIALLPTGAGKSLCFQLTALLRPGVTIVISPLIALMRDQVQNLLDRSIEVVGAILSGQKSDEREETLAQLRAGRLKLLYVSPERLRDPALLDALSAANVSQVVIDEAHCVVTWGPQFRPDFLRVNRLLDRLPTRPPVAAFTATATPPMRREIAEALQLRDPVTVAASFDRPELRLIVANKGSVNHPVRTKRDRLALVLRILQAADREGASSLVYVSTTTEAELLARRLRAMGFAAAAYHGKLDSIQREIIQEQFMDDQITTVVCTKAFGMGIDKPDIRYVIHAQMPGDLESYYQEAGRAGRDGRPAYCILIPHESDDKIHEYFIEQAAPNAATMNALIRAIRRRIVTDGSRMTAIIDAEDLAEEVDLDETHLNVTLHRLEQAGVMIRGDDVNLQAALTLRDTPESIAQSLDALEDRELLERAVSTFGWRPEERHELDLLEAANALSVPIQRLDSLLLRLAADDALLYRPWRRGMFLEALPAIDQLAGSVAVQPGDDPRPAMKEKLRQIRHYADVAGRASRDTQGRPLCRKAMILRYFGEEPSTERCGTCDLCQPDARHPWSQLLTRDVAGVADFFDPAFTVLEVVKWNEDRLARGRLPFGQRALRLVLLGDSWNLIRYEQDSARRSARLASLRACPYWGVFEAAKRREELVDNAFDRLKSEGYLAETVVTNGAGQSWSIPILTAKAKERLQSGETFQ